MADLLQRKKIYSFSTYAPEVLGNNFQNVKVMAILDYDTARSTGIDLLSRHRQVYPRLPQGSSNRPEDYDYAKIALSDGTYTVLGLPWIVPNSIVEIGAQTIVVKIYDRTSADLDRVRNALLSNSITNFNITIDEVQ